MTGHFLAVEAPGRTWRVLRGGTGGPLLGTVRREPDGWCWYVPFRRGRPGRRGCTFEDALVKLGVPRAEARFLVERMGL